MTGMTDVLAYSFLPVLMMFLGWVIGVGVIKNHARKNRFRVTLRKSTLRKSTLMIM